MTETHHFALPALFLHRRNSAEQRKIECRRSGASLLARNPKAGRHDFSGARQGVDNLASLNPMINLGDRFIKALDAGTIRQDRIASRTLSGILAKNVSRRSARVRRMSNSTTKNIIVVIGPGQIGQAIARRIGIGKHVVLADMRKENADAAAVVLANAGYDVSIATVDVSSREAVHALVETATRLGDVTGLIHAAGVSPS